MKSFLTSLFFLSAASLFAASGDLIITQETGTGGAYVTTRTIPQASALVATGTGKHITTLIPTSGTGVLVTVGTSTVTFALSGTLSTSGTVAAPTASGTTWAAVLVNGTTYNLQLIKP